LQEENFSQIDKDLTRTYTSIKFYCKESKGRRDLSKLLRILLLKYTGIGYVQGMNFLCAALLYHAEPEIALIFVTYLYEECELCDIYKDDLAGLHERNAQIKNLIALKLPDLYQHMCT